MSGPAASSSALHGRAGRPGLDTRLVVEAARAAVRPPGPVQWIAEPRSDGVELRTVVRRWSRAVEPPARAARVAGGAALRAARLAVAVQGRRPLVSHPDRPGLLAVLHAGSPVAPQREELLLYALLRRGTTPASGGARVPDRAVALQQLRRAAEVEGAWLRTLAAVPASPVLGPCWQDPDDQHAAGVARATTVALVGAAGRVPCADLRVGQAIQMIGLTATALGLDTQVLAAPVAPPAPGSTLFSRSGADTLAVVQVRWPA